jgi:hypothetical protein
MTTLRAIFCRLLGLFRRERYEAEMNAELRVHLGEPIAPQVMRALVRTFCAAVMLACGVIRSFASGRRGSGRCSLIFRIPALGGIQHVRGEEAADSVRRGALSRNQSGQLPA